MKLKEIKNIGLWVAIGLNLFLFAEYLFDRNNAKSVVLIFWIQSIAMGIQNVLMMLFARTGQSLIVNDVPVKSNVFNNIFMAGFFTIHYGIFILAFGAIAVVSDNVPGEITGRTWVFPTIILLLIGAVLELPQKILAVREQNTPLMKLMFTPYIRLIPLVAIFFGGAYLQSLWLFPLFLLLKLIVDLVYYRFLEVRAGNGFKGE